MEDLMSVKVNHSREDKPKSAVISYKNPFNAYSTMTTGANDFLEDNKKGTYRKRSFENFW